MSGTNQYKVTAILSDGYEISRVVEAKSGFEAVQIYDKQVKRDWGFGCLTENNVKIKKVAKNGR